MSSTKPKRAKRRVRRARASSGKRKSRKLDAKRGDATQMDRPPGFENRCLNKPTAPAYSQALRDQVLNAHETIQDLADRFGVSQAYVSKAKTRLRETGDRTAHRPRRKLEPYFDALRARVRKIPDLTLE